MFIEDNYILISSSRLSFASFLWSPTRSKRKKRSHANFGLRGFCYYSAGYFYTFVILSIRVLGCLSKVHELLRALLENLSHHRAKCCECYHPSPTHNFAGLSAVRLLRSPQPHRTLLQRRIVSELCKLSSS